MTGDGGGALDRRAAVAARAKQERLAYHELPYGQSISEQSEPTQPDEHEQRNVGVPAQTPWPEHDVSPGHAVIVVVA